MTFDADSNKYNLWSLMMPIKSYKLERIWLISKNKEIPMRNQTILMKNSSSSSLVYQKDLR